MNLINNQTKNYNSKKNITNEKQAILESLKENLDEKTKVKIWLRTLLYSYRIIPKIINTIDKIIYTRASNYSFSANIFNATRRLENQINIVIDMSERKQKLLNIYVMIKQMLGYLSDEQYNFAIKKFYEQLTNDELAEEFDVSVRTVFRMANELLEILYKYVTKHNWSLRFIELQVKGEEWLIERYNKYIDEYLIDKFKC